MTSGATSLAQLSSSLPHWRNLVPHLSSKHSSNTQATLACLHTRTHARTLSTSACFHALVWLCYGHKHTAQTSYGTCIHARVGSCVHLPRAIHEWYEQCAYLTSICPPSGVIFEGILPLGGVGGPVGHQLRPSNLLPPQCILTGTYICILSAKKRERE